MYFSHLSLLRSSSEEVVKPPPPAFNCMIAVLSPLIIKRSNATPYYTFSVRVAATGCHVVKSRCRMLKEGAIHF